MTLSLMTVCSTVAGVTQEGVRSTEGTCFKDLIIALESVEVPLTSPLGGLIPARK